MTPKIPESPAKKEGLKLPNVSKLRSIFGEKPKLNANLHTNQPSSEKMGIDSNRAPTLPNVKALRSMFEPNKPKEVVVAPIPREGTITKAHKIFEEKSKQNKVYSNPYREQLNAEGRKHVKFADTVENIQGNASHKSQNMAPAKLKGILKPTRDVVGDRTAKIEKNRADKASGHNTQRR